MSETQYESAAACRKEGEQDFSCKLCGHCCEGKGGIIVSDADLDRLCKFLRMSAKDFEKDWGVRQGGKLLIRSDKNGCVFFRRGEGCAIHVAKPNICRAWPYFRGNLVDGESFALAKAYCPGIPQSQPHAEFVRRGIECLLREGLVGSGQPDEAGALQISDFLESLAYDAGKR